MISFNPRNVLVTIGMGKHADDYFEGNQVLYFEESKLKLSDIWEGNGKARKNVLENGQVVSLYYLYDMGVSAANRQVWDVLIN